MKYKLRLDGLRFIAIMMVLFEHFVYFIGSKISGGFYGVNLFFVLSGYLIVSILLADSSPNFKTAYKKFLGRRILRIFPIYYLAIIFLLCINTPGIKEDFFWIVTYIFNYRIGQSNNWNTLYSPYWSLSVEEQFYLFFPIIVLLLKRKLKWLMFLLLVFVFMAFIQMSFDIFGLKKLNYVGLLTNMGALSLGAIGALMTFKSLLNKRFFTSPVVEIILLAVLIITITSSNWLLKMLLCPILNLFLIVKASSFSFSLKPIDQFLTNRHVVFVGRISYGIYLYHLIVSFFFSMYVFDPLWNQIPFKTFGLVSKLEYNPWIIKFPAVVLLTIFLASCSFKFLEMPILKLKEKYFR